jgi:hypothetical protein
MKLFLTLILLLSFNLALAQQSNVPVLEREVSLIAQNMPIETAFSSISNQADFVFSYSPKVISNTGYVNINARNKPVRFVLNQMFKENDIEYKVKGKYVILKKKNESKEKADTRVFEGYIYDSQTGEKLTEASIYNKGLMASAVTDQYGYFSMQIPANTPIKSLQISKLGYSDTLLVSIDSVVKNRNIEISLNRNDTLARRKLVNIDFHKIKPGWLVPNKLKVNARNISDPVFRSVQISLIPFLSTNHLLGGAAINDLSFNATIGYVNSVRYFEAGGILNFVRRDVSYFESAGIGNVVGGNVKGMQNAGIFNVTRRVKGVQAAGIFNQAISVNGVQASGIMNNANDTASVQLGGIGNTTKTSYFQAAGIFNFGKSITGAQGAGIYNSARSIEGVQAAGILNRARENASVQAAGIGNFSGNSIVQAAGIFNQTGSSNVQLAGIGNYASSASFQAAGLVNSADSLKDCQIAGLFNHANSSSNIQVAGLFNSSNGDADIQISGIFNRAKHVKKLQIALFNFSDTTSGLSLGLFSFIRKGYHKIELSADETFPYNIAYRTGSHRFHTFISAGTTKFTDNHLLNWGFGVGTSLGNPDKILLDIDLSSSEVSLNHDLKGTNHWYKLYLGIDKPLFKKLSIAAGLSYNFLLSDSLEPDYKSVSDLMPFYTLSDHNYSNGHNLKTWIGGKIALRFF